MSYDTLISWMTHLGEGTWISFRNAVKEVSAHDCNLSELTKRLRINLSDLGFADFFIENTQRWRVLPPVLGGLATRGNTVALYGGRTPTLTKELRNSAEIHGCGFVSEELQECPTLIYITGEPKQIQAVASDINVQYKPNSPISMAKEVTPIPSTLNNISSKVQVPLNWQEHSFDFKINKWTDGLLPNAACRLTPTYGHPKYFINKKRTGLLSISKRESLYIAAMLRGIRMIEYNFNTMNLSTPLFAPMPELYSRSACLCSYRPAEIVNNRITYCDVSPKVAALLMVATGQPHPGIAASPNEIIR